MKTYDDGEGYTPGDELVDWSRVEELQRRYDEVNAILDPKKRMRAAKLLVKELG